MKNISSYRLIKNYYGLKNIFNHFHFTTQRIEAILESFKSGFIKKKHMFLCRYTI